MADGANQVIVAAEAFGSGSESEQVTAKVTNLAGQWQGLMGKDKPLEGTIGAGNRGYFTEHRLKEAAEREIEGILPDPQFRQRDEQFEGRPEHGGKHRFTVEAVACDGQGNRYRCPAGKELSYKGQVKLNRNSGEKYQTKSSDCKDCPLRQRCIAGHGGKGNVYQE
ncbi:MAG: transposase [Treponema sp.]|nr:transposase [Treponema sp.]